MKLALRGIALIALSALIVFPASPTRHRNPAAAYVEGELLVKFRSAPGAAVPHSAVAVRGHAVVGALRQPGWVHVRIPAAQSTAQALAAYQSDPDVESVQPNYIYRAAALPNDSEFGQLWGLKNTGQAIASATYSPNVGIPGADMNIEKAWDHITDCSSVIVAVIDSGVNYSHEDLAGNMWSADATYRLHGTDFIGADNDPLDAHGHGTHIAAIIGAAGNNGTGVAGVCWRATIMALRVLDADGFGTTATITQGVNFAVSHGAKVINLSLGGGGLDPLLSEAITNAQANDVVVIAAAGNDGSNVDAGGAQYPCNFVQPNLLCVTALDQNYALASFANYGPASVDIGAPGTNILSAQGVRTRTMTDSFNTSGVLDWTNSGGWGYRRLSLSGTLFDVLVNPTTFPSGAYSNSADDRVYKVFDLSGAIGATLSFTVQHSLQTDDVLNVNYRRSGGDPFIGGVLLDGFTRTTGGVIGVSYDISSCVGGPCSVGFQLVTDASDASQGVGIGSLRIEASEVSNTSYRTRNGTSMAAPLVAGVAAMLRAYNPRFNYADVINAIKNGGRPVAALDGKTTTGRTVDAMSALAHINAPTGLSAVVR